MWMEVEIHLYEYMEIQDHSLRVGVLILTLFEHTTSTIEKSMPLEISEAVLDESMW
jgi:hypothetical protein